MIDDYFNFQLGSVSVKAKCPEDWKIKGALNFYHSPNHIDWGFRLSRKLFHESLHFWQTLAFGYLANLVLDDWIRFKHFENNGEVIKTSKLFEQFKRKESELPFSNYQLLECLTRYWDVHTRGSKRILYEDININSVNNELFVGSESTSFDEVMTMGSDCKVYGEPYRWMLEMASGDSAFVAYVFPVLAFFSFGTKNPAECFVANFCSISKSEEIKKVILNSKEQSKPINFAWFDIVYPIFKAFSINYKEVLFTSGFDVISRSELKFHPVYSNYLNQPQLARQYIKLEQLRINKNSFFLNQAIENFLFLFMFPGNPDYRFILGYFFPVYLCQFENINLYSYIPQTIWDTPGQRTDINDYLDFQDKYSLYKASIRSLETGIPVEAFL